MATPKYYGVTDFSPGINVEFDPRSIMPYTNESTQMEATHIENYDITEKGALIVAPGYESSISMGTGVPMKYVGNYEAAPNRRYLIGVSNDQVFYVRKWAHTPVHDCDAYNSGTYGTFASTGDASAPTTNTSSEIRGSGCVQFTIAAGGGLTGQSKLTVASLTSVDLSAYTDIEFYVNFSNVNLTGGAGGGYGLTNVVLRIGSSASDYYQQTFTENENGASNFIETWNGFKLTFADATQTGTPDNTALTFLEVEFNYNSEYNGGTILIDDIRATAAGTSYSVVEVTTNNLWQNTYDTGSIVNGVTFKGSNSEIHHILGNSNQDPLKLTSVGDGMIVAQGQDALPTKTYILTTALGFLIGANGRTVYYSDSEDETTQGGTIGFNGNVTGLAPTVDKTVLATLDTVNTEAIAFSFDDSALTYTPVKGEYQAGIGGFSHKAIQRRYNDTIFLGTEGVAFFGEQEELASGNYRISSLSWKIDKLIREMNDNKGQVAAGYYFRNRKEYGVALPIGPHSTTNNSLFIWKSQYSSWLYRSGIAMSHATEFREADNYELYFGDANSDTIMKFVDVYDYNGDSYVRRYKSKIFNMGVPLLHKRVEFIDIGGAMPKGCEFYVRIHVDGKTQTFLIDDSALIVNSITGGYIGDDYYGSEFFGGLIDTTNSYEFFRFYQRIPLPRGIVEGMEFQVEFYYEGSGRPHKIDLFGMKYTIQSEGKVPNRHINNSIANNVFIP